MLQGLPDDEEVENSSVSWEGGGSAATPKASLGGGALTRTTQNSPLGESSVRAGHSGPSGLNREHSTSGKHILRAQAERQRQVSLRVLFPKGFSG